MLLRKVRARMNKKTQIFRLTVVLIMLFALILTGCQSDETQSKKKSPTPSEKTIERSENSFGARYNYTLGEISNAIAEDAGSMNLELKNADWKTISAGLVDDNGVNYSSYCNREGKVTFTAAVEDESGKVMNIGCGCQTSQLDNTAYRSSFVRLAATIAVNAGGYDKNDLGYFMLLFKALLNDSNDTLYYEGSLYFKSVDNETTVLMVAPCDDKYLSEHEYAVYNEYAMQPSDSTDVK